MGETDAPSGAAEPPGLSDGMREALARELDLLYSLYTQTETSLQTTFNYYMGLITSITGAIIVVIQLAPPHGQAELTVCGLLGFATLVGAIYLSSVSSKYAHMARYARSLDTLRRFLLSAHGAPPLALYRDFVDQPVGRPGRRLTAWVLFPAGTYTFFIAAVNTAALAAAMWLFLLTQRVSLVSSQPTIAVCALLLFTVQNIYSHMVINSLTARFGAHVYIQDRMPFLSGKV